MYCLKSVICTLTSFPIPTCLCLLSHVDYFPSISPEFLLCHISILILPCFFIPCLHAYHLPLLFLALVSVHNSVCSPWLCYNHLLWSVRYDAGTPSAHWFPQVTTHSLIFHAFPSGEPRACSPPCPSSISGENKTLTCEQPARALICQPRVYSHICTC